MCVCVACSFGLIYVSEIAAVRFHWTRLNICTHTHVRVHMHGFNGLLSGEPALSLVVPSILGSDYCSRAFVTHYWTSVPLRHPLDATSHISDVHHGLHNYVAWSWLLTTSLAWCFQPKYNCNLPLSIDVSCHISWCFRPLLFATWHLNTTVLFSQPCCIVSANVNKAVSKVLLIKMGVILCVCSKYKYRQIILQVPYLAACVVLIIFWQFITFGHVSIRSVQLYTAGLRLVVIQYCFFLHCFM